jgi:hypothetical protein
VIDNDEANSRVFLDVPLGMSAHVPAQVLNQLGWTVGCTGDDCGTPVVSSVSVKSGTDSIIRLIVTGFGGTGFCLDMGQTITVGFNSVTGSISNTTQVGGSSNMVNQPLLSFSNQGVLEVCTGAGTTPPAGGLKAYWKVNDGSGTTVVSEVNTPAQDGALSGSPSWSATGGVREFTLLLF